MDKLIYDKQEHQEQCVENIISVLKDTQSCRDFSNLTNSIKTLHTEKNIPELKTHPIPKLDVMMETGTGKTFTYIQAMYELNKTYKVNRFIIFVPRKAIREGVIQNINMTSDHFFNSYRKRIRLYSYDGDGKVDGVKTFIRDDVFSVLILTNHSITSKSDKNRVLTKPTDDLIGNSSILDAIKGFKPVVVIDEPHLLVGDQFIKKYDAYFAESLCLRFGATFPLPSKKAKKANSQKASKIDSSKDKLSFSNAVFILDSLDALRNRLVKKIFVTTVSSDDNSIKFKARDDKLINISYTQDSVVKNATVVKGDDLGAVTSLSDYNGICISSISGNKVYLTGENRPHTISSHADYKLSPNDIRIMVRKTIEIHFEKEQNLFEQNIKTLSLFFIPSVCDFRGDNARVRKIFDEEYILQRANIIAKAKGEYKKYLLKDFDKNNQLNPIRGGYFSDDNKDETVADEVHKILRDKQKLLSTDDPLRFIFSVWALQEGWDNPNIFNICKLSPSDIDTSRRQQVGRGLRLSVNDYGIRQTFERCEKSNAIFYDKNSLDMIVSSGEGRFINEIQDEIKTVSYSLVGDTFTHQQLVQLGLNTNQVFKLIDLFQGDEAILFDEKLDAYNIIGPINELLYTHKKEILSFMIAAQYNRVVNFFKGSIENPAEERGKVKTVALRMQPVKELKELWDAINRKARISYHNINEDKLVDCIQERFANEQIDEALITIIKKEYDHDRNIIVIHDPTATDDIRFLKNSRTYSNFAMDFAKEEALPLRFVLSIFNKLDKHKIKNNPALAKKYLTEATQSAIHNEVIHKVGYKFDSNIKISAKDDPLYTASGVPRKRINYKLAGKYITNDIPADSYIYDKIVYDSKIEKKAALISEVPEYIQGMKIKVFAKLPRINIPTPYKDCNPDFAYLLESPDGGKKIYFVVETKGYDSINDIPADEQKKIDYAREFFKQLNKHNDKAYNTNKVKVEFITRINQTSLLSIIKEVLNGNDKERAVKK